MKLKQWLAVAAAATVLCAGLTTGLAGTCHSWRGYGAYRPAQTVSACSVAGCEKTYMHYHGTTLCSGHYNSDGHDHNWGACSAPGCTHTGYHTHYGATYCGHHTAQSSSSAGSAAGSGHHHGGSHH